MPEQIPGVTAVRKNFINLAKGGILQKVFAYAIMPIGKKAVISP